MGSDCTQSGRADGSTRKERTKGLVDRSIDGTNWCRQTNKMGGSQIYLNKTGRSRSTQENGRCSSYTYIINNGSWQTHLNNTSYQHRQLIDPPKQHKWVVNPPRQHKQLVNPPRQHKQLVNPPRPQVSNPRPLSPLRKKIENKKNIIGLLNKYLLIAVTLLIFLKRGLDCRLFILITKFR